MRALKQLREKHNLRQEEIARAIGVSRSTVAMWETSDAYPKGHVLEKLADVLSCSMDDLYGRNHTNRVEGGDIA